MPYCSVCGSEIEVGAVYCPKCGKKLGRELVEKKKRSKEPSCPKCGSTDIQVTSEGETRGYSLASGCLGTLLMGPFGVLCGLCGMGKGKTRAVRVCVACGKKF